MKSYITSIFLCCITFCMYGQGNRDTPTPGGIPEVENYNYLPLSKAPLAPFYLGFKKDNSWYKKAGLLTYNVVADHVLNLFHPKLNQAIPYNLTSSTFQNGFLNQQKSNTFLLNYSNHSLLMDNNTWYQVNLKR